MSYFLCQIYELLEGNFTSDALNWQMTILNTEQKAVFGEDKFVLFGDQKYGLNINYYIINKLLINYSISRSTRQHTCPAVTI